MHTLLSNLANRQTDKHGQKHLPPPLSEVLKEKVLQKVSRRPDKKTCLHFFVAASYSLRTVTKTFCAGVILYNYQSSMQNILNTYLT